MTPTFSEEELERQQRVFALVLLSVGLALGCGALREILGPDNLLSEILSPLRAAGGIGGVIFGAVFAWQALVLSRRCGRATYLEGFVQHANLKAMSIAWALTVAALAVMTELIDAGGSFSSGVYTRMASAVSMWTFSLAYFALTRVPGEPDDA